MATTIRETTTTTLCVFVPADYPLPDSLRVVPHSRRRMELRFDQPTDMLTFYASESRLGVKGVRGLIARDITQLLPMADAADDGYVD